MASTSCDKEGWLSKQSAWLKAWRRRYFRLNGAKLVFCKEPSDDPHGEIDLAQCLTVKSADDKTGMQHSFEVTTPDATFFMQAGSAAEKDEWIGAIGRAIVRSGTASRAKARPAAAKGAAAGGTDGGQQRSNQEDEDDEDDDDGDDDDGNAEYLD